MSVIFPGLVLFLYIACVQGKCPDLWVSAHSSCYFLFEDAEQWVAANDVCKLYQAHLVIVDTPDEYTFVKRLIKLTGASIDVWIGANDMMLEGVYRWVGINSKVNFTDWYPGEPSSSNENCVAITLKGAGGWIDSSCSGKQYYMCERSHIDDLVG